MNEELYPKASYNEGLNDTKKKCYKTAMSEMKLRGV